MARPRTGIPGSPAGTQVSPPSSDRVTPSSSVPIQSRLCLVGSATSRRPVERGWAAPRRISCTPAGAEHRRAVVVHVSPASSCAPRRRPHGSAIGTDAGPDAPGVEGIPLDGADLALVRVARTLRRRPARSGLRRCCGRSRRRPSRPARGPWSWGDGAARHEAAAVDRGGLPGVRRRVMAAAGGPEDEALASDRRPPARRRTVAAGATPAPRSTPIGSRTSTGTSGRLAGRASSAGLAGRHARSGAEPRTVGWP